MDDVPLKIATYPYDHVRALVDGTVTIEGVAPEFTSSRLVSDIFEGMVRDRAFDVAELGLTFYARLLDLPDPPFVALPIFPARLFRHSAIYVNTAAGIDEPKDLAGKTVGEFATYGHDAGVWAKGILSDYHGVTPEQCRWVIGGFDWPMRPFDYVPEPHPEDVDVRRAPEGRALGPMLESGEIDAFISADAPKAFIDGSPRVARLFPYVEELEREYFASTGIFPIMHVVVVRKELLEEHPGIERRIYDGFTAAKDAELEVLRRGLAFNHMGSTTPWLSHLFDRNRATLPDDWWPYGVARNRTAVDTFMRYHHEQGLSRHRLTSEDLFAPSLLDT